MADLEGLRIEPIELLALKKLAVISGALAASLESPAAVSELRALTRVLVDVINRAEAAALLPASTHPERKGPR